MKIIYSADNHITLDTPICRTDDFVTTQIKKLEWLDSIIKKHNAIFINGGDVGDKERFKSYLKTINWLNFMLLYYPDCIGIMGNHDQYDLSMEKLNKSLMSVLINAGVYTLIETPMEIEKDTWVHGFHFGTEITPFNESLYPEKSIHIAVFHGFVYKEKTSMIKGYNAKQLLYDNPQYDFILTGDHHTNFTETLDGQILINSGPLYRGSIDKINYEPVVYLINTDKNTFKEIKVPIIEGVISTEHKDVKVDRQNTMDSVVEIVKSSSSIALSFKDELEALVKENDTITNKRILEYRDKVLETYEEYIK